MEPIAVSIILLVFFVGLLVYRTSALRARTRSFPSHTLRGRIVHISDDDGLEADVTGYGRVLADVRVGRISINEEMVRRGHAWVYTRYVAVTLRYRYENLEWEARREGAGLWGARQRPVPPWSWRHR